MKLNNGFNINNDYEEIIKKEEMFKKELKSKNDLMGLALFYKSIERGSIITVGENFCKTCYIAGRLNNTSLIKDFINTKGALVDMVPEEYIELSKLLFQIGTIFPNLSMNYYYLLEKYSTKQKYIDLINDIFFDSHLLKQKIKKFDKELLNTSNKNFTQEFISEIFEKGFYNASIQYDVNEEVCFYYNKVNNSIVQKHHSECEQGIHYKILFPNTFEDFSNSIDIFFNQEIREDFYNQHLIDMFPSGFPYDYLKISQFDLTYFDLFSEFIIKNRSKFNIEDGKITEFKKYLALNWLNKVNKNPHCPSFER